MKILVIGGNRYFGKRLVSLLIAEGHEVTVLNRGSRPDDFGNKIHRLKADRSDIKQLIQAVGNDLWDIIYDQVCYLPGEAKAACDIFKGKVKKYIFTSTKSVYEDYGAHLKEEYFNPCKHPYDPLSHAPLSYSDGKQQAEAVFFQIADFPVTAVRFSIVLGTDDYTGRLEFHINRIAKGQEIYFPNIKAKMCFVSSADAARFLSLLKEKDFTGPINCASSEPISLEDQMHLIENVTGKSLKLARHETTDNPSPFGVPKDSYMNVEIAKNLGFEGAPLRKWLPLLIQEQWSLGHGNLF